ncbi:MAG: SPOR domain-containing protein [Bacteroidota bacterium]
MSRLDLITIGIVVVCLAALGYLVFKIVSLMNPPDEPVTTSIEDSYTTDNPDDLVYTDVGDEDTDWDDDEASTAISDEDPMGADAAGSYADTDATDETYSDADEAADPAPADSAAKDFDSGGSSGSSGSTSARSYDSAAGRYMVAAGSFRVRANADRLVNKLQSMGYNNARVSLFDRGSYAVVIVDRFDSFNSAKAMVTDLAKNGVDAIVREKS